MMERKQKVNEEQRRRKQQDLDEDQRIKQELEDLNSREKQAIAKEKGGGGMQRQESVPNL